MSLDEGCEYKYALDCGREYEYECGRSEGDGFSNPVELLVDDYDYADDEDWCGGSGGGDGNDGPGFPCHIYSSVSTLCPLFFKSNYPSSP